MQSLCLPDDLGSIRCVTSVKITKAPLRFHLVTLVLLIFVGQVEPQIASGQNSDESLVELNLTGTRKPATVGRSGVKTDGRAFSLQRRPC